MPEPTFPPDAIEAITARLRYGLNQRSWDQVTAGLPRWRVGTATFISEDQLRRAIKLLARFESAPVGAS
jgi:hypothetical protein